MNNPLGVSPSKGKQGTTRGKEKSLLTSVEIEPTTFKRDPICVPSATRHNIHMYPYFLFAAIHHLKSSLTFSVRPCSSVSRVTVDLFRRSCMGSIPTEVKRFFSSWPRVVPCFPLLGLTPSGLFMGLSSTIMYTSELILCSTIYGLILALFVYCKFMDHVKYIYHLIHLKQVTQFNIQHLSKNNFEQPRTVLKTQLCSKRDFSILMSHDT